MIPLFKVFTPSNIGERLQEVFDSGMLTEGEYSDRFEKEFSIFAGNPYTALTNSCTSALTLAYRMCDIGPGDEVITTPMTCMATNEPIFNAGARLVWADIEPGTGNIAPDSVREKITDRTKAIVAVHWAGQPFDVDAIQKIAFNRGIPVIADAAHALGALYKGRPVAKLCDFNCFSFQAIKHLTTVDGGAISCTNKLDYEKLKLLRWFGIDRGYGPKWEQDIKVSGYKFHMNNVNAAIGLEQMKHVQRIVDAHRANGRYYDENIKNQHVMKLIRPHGVESAHWIYSVMVTNTDRFKVFLAASGIASDPVHVRNDTYTVFREFYTQNRPGTDTFCHRMINIPVGWWLSNEDKGHIVRVVNAYEG